MSEHLSSEQIADFVAGIVPAKAAQHVSQCRECSGEVQRFSESLQMFRMAVRETGSGYGDRQRVLTMPKRRRAVIWATIAAALVTLLAAPTYQFRQTQRKAEVARQDSELMDEVNAGLSEDVASPMKPLEKMVTWGPDAKKAGEVRDF